MILVAFKAIRQTLSPDLPQHARAGTVHSVDALEVPAVALRRAQLAKLTQQTPAPARIQKQSPRTRQADLRAGRAFPDCDGRDDGPRPPGTPPSVNAALVRQQRIPADRAR